jgi:nucleoid DNA-binding protein
MGTLTKRDLVVQISNEVGAVQSLIFDVIQRTLDQITDALARGDTVELRNFGVLEVRLTKPRVGRNPNEPDSEFTIPARATVRFKPGKIMRQRVRNLSATLKREAKERRPKKTGGAATDPSPDA